jgi:hypothetical protein
MGLQRQVDMRRNTGLYLSLVIVASCGTKTDSYRVDLGSGVQWPAVQLVEAFDHATQMKPLSGGTEPELRVWQSEAFGQTSGYSIASNRALSCSVQYRNDGRTASVEQGRCVASDLSAEKRRTVMDLLPELSALDGRQWNCAFGGETTFVEGNVNQRRFTFIVSNPDVCKDSSSSLVARLRAVLRGNP